jgi:hypothetical protein
MALGEIRDDLTGILNDYLGGLRDYFTKNLIQ